MPQKRRRTSKRKSFGSHNLRNSEDEHFKNFLNIVLFMLLRSSVKKTAIGKSHSENINNDLLAIEKNSISLLTITSILELLEKLVGKENKEKIISAYTLLSIIDLV